MTKPTGSPESETAPSGKKKYKGTSFNRTCRINKWTSQISCQGKTLGLGAFLTEFEAAVAYDKACLYLRGRDAELNFKLSEYLDARGEMIEDPGIRDRIIKCTKGFGIKRWVDSLSSYSHMFSHAIYSLLLMPLASRVQTGLPLRSTRCSSGSEKTPEERRKCKGIHFEDPDSRSRPYEAHCKR